MVIEDEVKKFELIGIDEPYKVRFGGGSWLLLLSFTSKKNLILACKKWELLDSVIFSMVGFEYKYVNLALFEYKVKSLN